MVDPNPTEMVNPSPASIEAFIARPDPNAIIMVNLLRYSKGGGRESYLRYAAVASGTVQARGGSFPFAAPVLEGDWDMVALVRYPRRAAYLDMQNDPAYVGAIPDRTAGLAARLLHPFHHPDGDPDDPFDIEVRGDDERFLVSLVRWADPSAPSTALVTPGGEVVLRLRADMPLVSDDEWHELVVVRLDDAGRIPRLASDSSGLVASVDLVTAAPRRGVPR